ncbi:MAG TPA: hypothetical protein VJ740_13340 [Hyphomicrobiaceae bacterium]|jgi:hypothetical protein|nr:hypothetical protein [Hyphomicrobiaceae bacterium]
MKTVPRPAVALALGAVLLAGGALAQSDPAPTPPATIQPFPGIIINPPRAVPPDTPRLPPDGQHSCPNTNTKLELLV